MLRWRLLPRAWLARRKLQDQPLHNLCQRLADRRLEVEADELKHGEHLDRYQLLDRLDGFGIVVTRKPRKVFDGGDELVRDVRDLFGRYPLSD